MRRNAGSHGCPNLIIVNSRGGLDALLRKGFLREKIVVVHNGFDINTFRPDLAARSRMRAEFGLNPETLLIGLPARLDPGEGPSNFSARRRGLATRKNNVRFICLGGGGSEAYTAKLREMARSLGVADRMIWAGDRTDMSAALNALEISTLCSVSEGFPNTVGEAMACGVPCVVTDVGDARLLCGDTGIVVPKSDPAALAEAWARLSDPALRARLG